MIFWKYSATYCVIKASLYSNELLMWNIIVKVSRFLLPLLGFALVESCAQDMYGCPYADFEAKGCVSDEDGKGIQGVRVVISADYLNTNYSGAPLTDTLWTDHKGEYITKPAGLTSLTSTASISVSITSSVSATAYIAVKSAFSIGRPLYASMVNTTVATKRMIARIN